MRNNRSSGSFGVFGGFILLLITSLSPQASAANLIQTYRMAQSNDASFLAARSAFAAAMQKLPQARARLLPNLSLNGGDNWTRGITKFGNLAPVERGIRTWNWNIQLDQPIFRVARIYAYKQSEYAVQQAKIRFDEANSALILRVAKAYFAVLIAREGVNAANARVAAMRQQVKRAKHGFHAGIAAITDVYEAKSRFELARSRSIAATDALENKRAELEKITHEWPIALAGLGGTTAIPTPVPDDKETWIRKARVDNLRVKEYEAARSAAAAGVSRVLAGNLPKVDFRASYGRNYSSGNSISIQNYSTDSKTWEVGVRVSVPLFSGGESDSQEVEAVAKRNESQFKLQSVRRQAAVEARRAYDGVKDGVAQIAALESSLQAARNSVKGNRAGYRLGVRINLNVLDAQEQLYVTKRELAKARYDALLQGLKLKAATGSLSVRDLVTLDALLTKQQDVQDRSSHSHTLTMSQVSDVKGAGPDMSKVSISQPITASLQAP